MYNLNRTWNTYTVSGSYPTLIGTQHLADICLTYINQIKQACIPTRLDVKSIPMNYTLMIVFDMLQLQGNVTGYGRCQWGRLRRNYRSLITHRNFKWPLDEENSFIQCTSPYWHGDVLRNITDRFGETF